MCWAPCSSLEMRTQDERLMMWLCDRGVLTILFAYLAPGDSRACCPCLTVDTGYTQGPGPPCPRAVAALHEPAKEHFRACPCSYWACQSCQSPCSAFPCYLDAAGRAGSILAVASGSLGMAVGVLRAVVVGTLQGLEGLAEQLAAVVEIQLGPC